MIELSIIIVSWNVADLLEICLNSILRNTNPAKTEIIVVDSASADDSVDRLRANYPQIKLMAQAENLGFSRSNNIGLAAASGNYLMLLNPDTEIIEDALGQMQQYLEDHPDVGIVGPHTLNSDGTTQSTRRRFPSLLIGFFESTWFQGFAPKSMLTNYYVENEPDNAVIDVDWVQGSALMTRRTVYEQIGGLDEGYTMYSEEIDWCKRAKAAQWRVVYLGTARIIHHGGKSSEQVTARKHIHFQESKLRYFRKYHGWLPSQLLRGFLMLNYVCQIIVESAKGLLGHKRGLRRERIRAYWQVLRSGLKAS